MAATLSQGVAGVSRFLRKEVAAVWPVFLFFLAGFLLLLLLVKLALAQYSIEITALSSALVGALIAAKAALVLDETPLARVLERYRRIVAVAVKTFLYGIASLLLGSLERVVEALHKTHKIGGAIGYVIDHAGEDRLLGWALGVSIIFALYFSFAEISRYMGKGALANLFFGSSPRADFSGEASNVSPVVRGD